LRWPPWPPALNVASNGDDDGDLPADEVRRQCWQSLILTISPTVFDRHVLALDIASFLQQATSEARVLTGLYSALTCEPRISLGRFLLSCDPRSSPPLGAPPSLSHLWRDSWLGLCESLGCLSGMARVCGAVSFPAGLSKSLLRGNLPDHRSKAFNLSESVQHPAFYMYRESYPRRNGSPRNCCSRAGDGRSAVPVSV
jgi:hypothetical protein